MGRTTEGGLLRERVLVSLPLAAMLIAVGSLAGAIHAVAAAPADERTAAQLTQAVGASRELSAQMVPYDAVFRRDPMRALVNERGELVTSVGLQSGFAVQGIIWSTERPLVIVDDELFAPGASVGPYAILQIQPDGVVVKREGEAALFIPLDRGLAPPEVTPAEPAVVPDAAAP